MKNGEELKPQIDKICEDFIKLSESNPTVEQEAEFLDAAYKKMKDDFEDEQDFFLYLNEALKNYINENGLTK